MMAAIDLDAEIDRLYGLPLGQFTAARDDLARRLRADGDRDGAAGVKRLRKPTLPAWALNQAKRREPEQVAELIEAGRRLQDAQQQLVAGGERGLLRSAAADERRLVEQVVAVAEQELAGAGHPVAATVQSKLWATVHAAAVSDEARELLDAGRLIVDYEISDLGLGAGGAAAPPTSRAKPPAKREPRPDRAAIAARKQAARKAEMLRRKLDRARAQYEAAEERLKGARRGVAEARREAARAASVLERAEAAAEQAREREEAAASAVEELELELQELESGS
jgi:hypothetical protein